MNTLEEPGPAPPPAGRASHPRRRFTAGGVVAGILVLLAVLVCARLGFWQLDRLAERRAQNEALLRALDAPPLALDAGAAAAISRDPAAFQFRRVLLEGAFPGASEVILRGRSYQGQPGVHIVAPLELAGGEAAVVVNRGWIRAADGVTTDPRSVAAPGRQQIEGIIQLFPDAEGAGTPMEIEVGGFRVASLGRLDREALQSWAARPLLPFYVQQIPGPGVAEPPVRLPIPAVDEGPHLSYAVQWFGFALVFLVGFAVVVARRPDLDGEPGPPEG